MAEEQIVGSPERDIHVQALVHLEKIQVKKVEDDELELYSCRAKIYRYVVDPEDGGMWKERGVGDVKILKHKSKDTYRLLMRRDKTLKLCANHFITPNMELKPHSNSEKAFVWSTPSDFADGEGSPETLCIRFGKVESATEFKEKFAECAGCDKASTTTKGNTDTESAPTDGEGNAVGDTLASDLSSLNVKDEKDKNETNDQKSEEEKDNNKNENAETTQSESAQ